MTLEKNAYMPRPKATAWQVRMELYGPREQVQVYSDQIEKVVATQRGKARSVFEADAKKLSSGFGTVVGVFNDQANAQGFVVRLPQLLSRYGKRGHGSVVMTSASVAPSALALA